MAPRQGLPVWVSTPARAAVPVSGSDGADREQSDLGIIEQVGVADMGI
jgi:hypothetical protein